LRKSSVLVDREPVPARFIQNVGPVRFTIRVWNAHHLIDAVCRAYNRLPEEMQAALPLKQVWIYVESEGWSGRLLGVVSGARLGESEQGTTLWVTHLTQKEMLEAADTSRETYMDTHDN